jgi:hypothetical protein
MSDDAAYVEEALGIARNLVLAGIPVFAAPPAPGTKIGFRLPSRWQQTKAETAQVDAWQPGYALCMVCGMGLDVIDIDSYAGGGPSATRLNGTMPRVYGMAETPSGGGHLFVASLGVRSINGFYPGLDVKAGDREGRGRGFVFIPPTCKPSKVDGQPGCYRWI